MENKFTNIFKRLNNDLIPEAGDNTSYNMALHAVKKGIKGKGYGLANEGSTKKVFNIPEEIVGYVEVESRDWVILLLKNGELGYFDIENAIYVSIYNLNDLNKETNDGCGNVEKIEGCDFSFDCEYVHLEYNFWNQCNELHIQFSHGCVFYTVNIDELLDEKRRANVTCSDIQTFKCDCMPTLRAVKAEGGGALLENGKYSFTARIINKDGHKTNWFNISNDVSVGGGTNKPGEISNEYIIVYISNLSCRYSAIEIAVIRQIGDGVTAEVLDRIDYNNSGIAFEYRGRTGEETSISIEEITTRKVNFLRGRALKIHDGRMFYYQIKNAKNFNTQEWVSTAQIKLKVYKVPVSVAHMYRGLQPGERYLIGAVPQMCDGTEQRVGVFSGGGGLEGRGSGGDGDTNYNYDNIGPGGAAPSGAPVTPTQEGGGSGGSGSSGGNGNINFDSTNNDEYKPYDQLPKDHHVVQQDGYYTDGCVTNTGECEDLGKSMVDGIGQAAEDFPDDSDESNPAEDCPDCGNDPLKRVLLGFKKLFSKGLFRGITISISRNRKNKKSKQPDGNGIKDTLKKTLDELRQEEVHVPERVKVKDTNSKNNVTGGASFVFDGTKTIGEQMDDINLFFVGDMEPKWFHSSEKYPKTRDCGGGFVYGDLAGASVQLLEVPYIVHFVSSTTGAKSSHTLGMDERSGYVFMVGIGIYGLRELTEADLGKPPCKSQPWKIVYARRDALNSRILGSGILIDTMRGDVNNRPHAIARHGLNSRENLDKHIGVGGDLFEHEGQDNDGANIYMFLGPDTILGKIPLVANKFIKLGDMSGDGWRHGLYASHTRRYGWTERPLDQRGCRETINLHTFTPGVSELDILGICKADGDRIIDVSRGFDMPICNLSRESSVALKLSGSAGHPKDKSFIADGKEHFGPVLEASCPFGLLARDIPNQYGSVVNQSYVDLGLYAKPGATSVEGLVGDSFVNVFNVRRTSYVSDRVGDRTFIPSPRKWSGIARFFGFGDPSEPPESGDERDPKNMANRYPGMGIIEAANSTGSGSVYYPGVLKCLVVFFAMSRVNPYYRQRGDEDKGEVHAWNLGRLYLDSSIPMGTPWEDSWLNRFYKVIVRQSKLDSLLVWVIRVGVILGMPLWFIYNGLEVNALWDIPTSIMRTVIFALIWIIAILLLTPSRIRKMLGLKEQLKDREGGATDENIRQWEDIYREYSSEYNAGGVVGTSYGIPDPFNTCDCDDCTEKIYYRPGGVPTQGINNLIYYTPKQYQGTEINAFKNVLEGNYGEMGTKAGQLQRLFSLNNMLYALTTDGVWRLSYNSNGDANYKDLDYLLGNGMALGTPHRIGEGIEEGFRGTVDPNSFIITPYGALWVDYKNRAPVLFNGSSARLLNDGVSDLLYDYMPFCNGNTCRDQKMGTGVWYSLGYDPKLDRLLMTKKDGDIGGSWTLSYDFSERTWISAHEYIPNMYIWDKNSLYSVYDKGIWLHNLDSSKQIIYNKYRPFKIWFYSVNLQPILNHAAAMEVDAIEIHTIADEIGGAMNRDITFNMGGWSNSYQMTGLYLLDTDYYICKTHKDIRDRGFSSQLYRGNPGLWRFNEIKDNIKDDTKAILVRGECSFIEEYANNADCSGGNGNKSKFEDYYLRHCLIFDDAEKTNIELKLLRIIGYGSKKQN